MQSLPRKKKEKKKGLQNCLYTDAYKPFQRHLRKNNNNNLLQFDEPEENNNQHLPFQVEMNSNYLALEYK